MIPCGNTLRVGIGFGLLGWRSASVTYHLFRDVAYYRYSNPMSETPSFSDPPVKDALVYVTPEA
jgi:hypothetical protein